MFLVTEIMNNKEETIINCKHYLYALFRRLFGLPVHTGYDNMAGDSHSHTTINAMKLMYPHPEDVELFVGGKG